MTACDGIPAGQSLDFIRDGAALFASALADDTVSRLRNMADGSAGARLGLGSMDDALSSATQIAVHLIGAGARPVRAVMFDKTPARNWALGWHQDRTIAVREKIQTEGFGPWTIKQGIQHVAPPIEILERMATLRIHIDPCGAENAPLKVALGSHLLGRVPSNEVANQALARPCITCQADPGDVWAYATPILHASDRAAPPSRRRVLQVDYAAFDLPAPLAWLGTD